VCCLCVIVEGRLRDLERETKGFLSYYCFSCGEKLMGFVCLFVFAVHKQRDIVPLDVNGDVGNSNSDYETPVFDLKVSVCPFYIKLY
jgi:hypothetical protein